jgi:Uma2 family endonuclease
MTPGLGTRIHPDNAFVLDPKHLGVSATGRDLEKLFVAFCKQNLQSPWQFELSPEGEIIATPPVNHPGDAHENQLAADVQYWSREFGGEARGSNAAFLMPLGGLFAPDVSWTSPKRWSAHPHLSGEPNPFCADFVVEIRSGSDNVAPLQAKMQLYVQNGALLGWLIDPPNHRVYVYREGQPDPEVIDNLETISGEEVLPGFTFEVARWIFNVT